MVQRTIFYVEFFAKFLCLLPTSPVYTPDTFYEYPICIKASCPIVANRGAGGSFQSRPNKANMEANKVCNEHGDSSATCEMGNCKCTESSQPRYHGKLCEHVLKIVICMLEN